MQGIEQFGRSIRVLVHGIELVNQPAFGSEDTDPTLDCTFTCTQSCKPEPSPSTVVLYNLSKENRDRLTQQQDRSRQIGWKRMQAVQTGAILVEPGQEAAIQQALVADTGIVEVYAGYQDDAKLLFKHQILPDGGIDHRYEAPDWVTTIKAQDGRLPWMNAWVTQSMAPGVQLRDVQRVLAASEQYLEGTLDEETFASAYPELLKYKPTPGYQNGVVLHGPTKDLNNDLLETLGLDAFYLNGELVYTIKGAAFWPQAVRLSQANNVIGAPEKMDRGFYRVQTLLDPRVIPGRQVQLFGPDDVTRIGVGTFRVDEVSHTGSNWQTPFYSSAILRPSGLVATANP